MREPRRVSPRLRPAGADTGTLAALGRAELPPEPSPDPPARPGRGGPRPDEARVERAGRLADALTEAGVPVDADDAAAVDALSGLDEATLATITEWIRHDRRTPPGRDEGGPAV